MPRGINIYDEARLQGRLWTPALWRGAGLEGLYETGDLSTIEISTGTKTLRDKSGLGRDLTQATGSKQPAYSYGGMGGRPTLVATAASSQVMLASVSPTITSSSLSVFVVATATLSVSGFARVCSLNEPVVSGDDYNTVHCMLLCTSSNSSVLCAYRNSVEVDAPTSIAFSTPFIFGAVYDGTNCTSYLNGKPSTAAGSTGAFSITQFEICNGYQGGAVANPWDGQFRSIAIMSKALSQPDRNKLEGYLAWEAWQQDKLITGHPFKNRPPLIGD